MSYDDRRRQAREDAQGLSSPSNFWASIFEDRAEWTDRQWDEHDARVAAEKAEQDRQEALERARRLRRSLEAAGFPERALDAAEAADESKPSIVRVKTWDPRAESVLVLSGPPGCGKTVAAAWWALNRARYPMFLRASTFAAASRYDQEKRSSWTQAAGLVLDDLGTEYADAKGSFQVDLDELIDVFYGSRRPLLITTNCSADDFKKRYGSRITDRLRECGSWFSTSSKSLRRKP